MLNTYIIENIILIKVDMVHDLLVRGFDDKIHSQLGELAKEKGVSINSIVKDAVDKWLNNDNQIFQKNIIF